MPLAPLSALWGRVRTWPVESQLGARRNAMVASTALAARRAERTDVDDYFAALTAPPVAPALPATART
ncbi:hypothetical protein G5V58_05220 [Nocardioides anomalus]|uniref:Uncharacterized protein n=1 Tax=Nocardioides anomalus TaxID=2712223 RepID=A0A6G6WAJ2_9ACTN|nr:hypothetical protein [Nocardioides anomalus]QIG42244.1 hypothetical protein G5V58_05220 [Nocardioides anomalus]